MKILEPKYGEYFVDREDKIEELKRKIKDNGVVVVTGDRGIGKTNLIQIIKQFFEKEKDCHYNCHNIDGSKFSECTSRIFLPEKTTTGFSLSISILGIGGGTGISWKPREPNILEYMEKSKEKIIFVENAHELKKEDLENVFLAVRSNSRLRFVLEIATLYMPELKLKIYSDQIVDLKKLGDEDIKKIVKKERIFQDVVVNRIVFLSNGYPYIAMSLAYICDKKSTQDEIFEFLNTLRDNDTKYNLDQIHKEVLETLEKDTQNVIKKLALAPHVLTLELIRAFCSDEIDNALNDLVERGILRHEKDVYLIYHPLFREFLRIRQPIALKKRKELYLNAMERVKSEFDSSYMLLEVLNEPDIFNALIEIAENYEAINLVGIRIFTWGKIDQAISAWFRILKKAKESKEEEWELIAIGHLGNVCQALGDARKAIVYYEEALRIAQEIGDRRNEGAALGSLGIAYNALGNVKKAIVHYEKALRIAQEIGDRRNEGAWLGNLGTAYRNLGDAKKAIEYYEKTLRIAQEIGDKQGEGTYLGNLGVAYGDLCEMNTAIEYYEKALRIAQEIEDRGGEGAVLGNLGTAYRNLGDAKKAIEYYEKTLRIVQEIGDKQGEGTYLGNLGGTYRNLGDAKKAIEYCEKALRIAQEIEDRKNEGAWLGNLGDAYRDLCEMNTAIEYYEKALGIAQEIGDRRNEGNHLGNLGLAYSDLDQVEKAIQYYEKALAIAQEIGDRRNEGVWLGNLGIAYCSLGQVEKAIQYYEKALAVDKEVGDRRMEGADLGNLGNVYSDLGQVEKAIDYYERALAIGKEIKDPKIIDYCEKILTSIRS